MYQICSPEFEYNLKLYFLKIYLFWGKKSNSGINTEYLRWVKCIFCYDSAFLVVVWMSMLRQRGYYVLDKHKDSLHLVSACVDILNIQKSLYYYQKILKVVFWNTSIR